MARKAFTEHPKFMDASRAANSALFGALDDLGVTAADFAGAAFDDHANRADTAVSP